VRKRILIVDEDADLRRYFSMALQLAGFETAHAALRKIVWQNKSHLSHTLLANFDKFIEVVFSPGRSERAHLWTRPPAPTSREFSGARTAHCGERRAEPLRNQSSFYGFMMLCT
jgi:hypothetical protein